MNANAGTERRRNSTSETVDRCPPHVILNSDSLNHTRICDKYGRPIGTMADIIVDAAKGSIVYAVLSLNHPVVAERAFRAIPWAMITLHPEDATFIISLDSNYIDDAPALDETYREDLTDPAQAANIHEYFGCHGYW